METPRQILERILPPILRWAICPRCECQGEVDLFDEHANGGLGLECRSCGTRHPFEGVQWLPQKNGHRSNAIGALPKEAQDRCYVCGLSREQLKLVGRGLQGHHVDPEVVAGAEGRLIPLCTQCHPIASALQHSAGRLIRSGLLLVEVEPEEVLDGPL